MDIFQPDLISKTIPWLISLAGMTLFALFIFYDDLKKMKIVAWKLLSFIGIGFLVFYISHIYYNLTSGFFFFYLFSPVSCLYHSSPSDSSPPSPLLLP